MRREGLFLFYGSDAVLLRHCLQLFLAGLAIPTETDNHKGYEYKSRNCVFIHKCYVVLFL